MMLDPELQAFGESLAELHLKEFETAIALIWFFDHCGDANELTVRNIADLMHDLSLSARINPSRLAKKLTNHGDVIKGSSKEAFKLRLASKPKLADEYEPLLKRPQPKIENHIISKDDFSGTRIYLDSLVSQINGSYQFGFYDCCIIMCRRLMETLLIEAFEHNGHGSAIKSNKEYRPLSDIISAARSGQYFKLARGTGKVLEEVKEAGDAGAHSRTYVTKKPDIDHIKLAFRRVVSELMHHANISPA